MQLLHAGEDKTTKKKTQQHSLQQVQNTSVFERKKEAIENNILTFWWLMISHESLYTDKDVRFRYANVESCIRGMYEHNPDSAAIMLHTRGHDTPQGRSQEDSAENNQFHTAST